MNGVSQNETVLKEALQTAQEKLSMPSRQWLYVVVSPLPSTPLSFVQSISTQLLICDMLSGHGRSLTSLFLVAQVLLGINMFGEKCKCLFSRVMKTQIYYIIRKHIQEANCSMLMFIFTFIYTFLLSQTQLAHL